MICQQAGFYMEALIHSLTISPRFGRSLVSMTLLLLCASLLSCQPQQQQQMSEGKRYELKGKVVSVDRVQQRVTIAHEEIRDYMDAMTMPFNLKDPSIISDIMPGDAIQATLVVSDSSAWLEDVVLTKPGVKIPAAEQPAAAQEANPGDTAPDFTLVNQDGKRLRLQQYKGKAVLLTFIYTRCPLPEYCTLMSDNFNAIDKELQKDSDLYKRTHLLSITIDPEYDNPKVLRSYGAAHTGNYTSETFKHWEFATGTKDEIKAIAQFFGLTYYPEKDQIVHSLRTAVIAPDGKVYKVYRGNEWKPEEVVRDLQALKTVMGDR
jgi:protein SCO1/2